MMTETRAYYLGRNHYWNGFKPDPQAAMGFEESYKRGYRHARSEDRLDADTEWDD